MFGLFVSTHQELITQPLIQKDLTINLLYKSNILELLNKIAKEEKDKKLTQAIKMGLVKCAVCGGLLGKSFENFGGAIKALNGKWVILCKDMGCYNKALSK